MESEKFFFKKEILEFQEKKEKEPKETYINEVFSEVKDKLREYLPNFYRDIPTRLNYQDNTEDLKINYHFEGDNLNINIRTPENFSGKTVDDLKKLRGNFLVFQDVAKNETISKKTQDFFFLSHEYIHGINQILLKEYRPDIIQIIEIKKKEFENADDTQKEKLRQEERNSVFPILGESLPISSERIIVEKLLQDETLDNETKNNAMKFWENHEKALTSKKLEDDPKSKYSELDEAMIYYKLYQKFEEKGILDFIKNFDFEKLSKIKKYSDPEQKVFSEEYKKIIEMDANKMMKEFATKEEN